MVQKMLVRRHRRSPFVEFSALHDANQIDRLARRPECLFHSHGVKLRRSKGLSKKILRGRLLAQCRRTRTNISNIEVGHSHTRKQIMRRVQVTRPSCVDISTSHVGKQCE